ncbi:hypothetical protein KY343_05765 [Candidatus Woesearchaeota archaeon]|nr:hypothetical protein [Candidatus Woesearchaeota archaeon]
MPEEDYNQNDISLIDEFIFHVKVREGGGKPGNPSLEITIPKWFCEKKGIRLGDIIKLKFEGFISKGGKKDERRKK